MTQTAVERAFSGIAASDGLVQGRVVLARSVADAERQAGTPDQERAAIDAAIDAATQRIAALSEQDTLAGDILEFQLALLDDEDLLAPVFAAVADGTSAHDAWATHLDAEIAEYRAGDDEYMSARADDLLDLKTRVLAALFGSDIDVNGGPADGAILVAGDLTPSRFLELDWNVVAGAATTGGSRTSHVSILARARGVPLVVGLKAMLSEIDDGAPALLDAEEGRLVTAPSATTLATIEARMRERRALQRRAEQALTEIATTRTGERVHVLLNVDDPGGLDALDSAHCDGIGLTRTEFLFHEGRLPNEDEQYDVYRRIIVWAAGRQVTIRTLDAGGDKPIPGVTPENDDNPFLGVRGLRLSLRHPDLFRIQLRALARAAVHGSLKVMLPMVTVPVELDRTRALLRQVVAELTDAGVPCRLPALGMMVEVPAAALTAERFDADFYSIGSNDLVQYTTACARGNPDLVDLADPLNPAVLQLIHATVRAGGARGVEVSLCGDMASDPATVPALLDTGLRTLSVAAAQLGRIKLAVAAYPADDGAP